MYKTPVNNRIFCKTPGGGFVLSAVLLLYRYIYIYMYIVGSSENDLISGVFFFFLGGGVLL